MGNQKVKIKTSFKEEIITSVEMGEKIQEAMANDTNFIRISENPVRIIKTNTILSLEYFTEKRPELDKLQLPNSVRAAENSEGYKKFSILKNRMLKKKSMK